MDIKNKHNVRVRIVSEDSHVIVHQATTWEENPVAYTIEWGALFALMATAGYLTIKLLSYVMEILL